MACKRTKQRSCKKQSSLFKQVIILDLIMEDFCYFSAHRTYFVSGSNSVMYIINLTNSLYPTDSYLKWKVLLGVGIIRYVFNLDL